MSPNALITIVTGAVAVTVFYGPWQWVCTDWIRQVYFEARDKIFDLAAHGDLAFNSPEYRHLRGRIEAEIRFAHEMTLPYILLLSLYLHYRKPNMIDDACRSENEMRLRISNLETRAIVDEVLGAANKRVLYLVMLKSPFLVALPILLAAPFYLCMRAVQTYARVLARSANALIGIGASLCDGGNARSVDEQSDGLARI